MGPDFRGLALLCTACAACAGGGDAPSGRRAESGGGPPPPIDLATDPIDVPPGQDRDGQCQVFTLHNEVELLLASVELTSTPGMHHSDWYVFPEEHDLGRGDGNAPCSAFSAVPPHGTGTSVVAFGQSTQSRYEKQVFGEHVALPLPARSKLYVAYHMLNATDEARSVSVSARLHFAEPDQVKKRLVMGGGLMLLLSVPPRERSVFYADCPFAAAADTTGYFVMPHYHEYGTGLFLELIGGNRAGERIWEGQGAIGDAMGGRLAPPITFGGAEGIRFGCSYDNTTDRMLEASNDGEMCNFYLHNDAAFPWYGVLAAAYSGSSLVDHGRDPDGVHIFEVTNCLMLGAAEEP